VVRERHTLIALYERRFLCSVSSFLLKAEWRMWLVIEWH
jgi:hypothetical protein